MQTCMINIELISQDRFDDVFSIMEKSFPVENTPMLSIRGVEYLTPRPPLALMTISSIGMYLIVTRGDTFAAIFVPDFL